MSKRLCSLCGQKLPWPFVPLSPLQREIINEIRYAQLEGRKIKDYTALGRLLKKNGAMVRAMVQRMNKRLSSQNMQISNKPVRLVAETEIRYTGT